MMFKLNYLVRMILREFKELHHLLYHDYACDLGIKPPAIGQSYEFPRADIRTWIIGNSRRGNFPLAPPRRPKNWSQRN